MKSAKKIRENTHVYERVMTYSVQEVMDMFRDWVRTGSFKNRMRKRIKTVIDGYLSKTYSQRYELFYTKGVTCVSCGVEGNMFALERSRTQSNSRYHLNLYHVKSDGTEVMMTKDHIIPKSKGGSNHISNYNTMCCDCNAKKADNYVQQ